MTFDDFLKTPQAEDWQFLVSTTTLDGVFICGCKDGSPCSGEGTEFIGRSTSSFELAWMDFFEKASGLIDAFEAPRVRKARKVRRT